jgi:hypothetical protein
MNLAENTLPLDTLSKISVIVIVICVLIVKLEAKLHNIFNIPKYINIYLTMKALGIKKPPPL